MSDNRTKLARKVGRLKESSFRLASQREKLPVPLFWSVFHLEIDSIKKEKHRSRMIRKIVDGIGE